MGADCLRFFRLGALGAAGILMSTILLAPQPTIANPPLPLAANDVSILFPVPKDGDMAGFISIADVVGSDGKPLLSLNAFNSFIGVAESDESKVVDGAGHSAKIFFPPETKDMKTWFVAGIRLDPGAPGLSADIREKFGPIPQLRLILQPVTRNAAGKLVVHDRTAHVIFSFGLGFEAQPESCPIQLMPRRTIPDTTGFRSLLDDFVALRDDLAAGKLGAAVTTDGLLRVHPGLNGPSQKLVRDRLVAIFAKHLKASQVNAMAVMGLPKGAPDPWIFMAMVQPAEDVVKAVPSPALDGKAKAEAVRFFGAEHVFPQPRADNQSAITTCFRPAPSRVGVSTAELLNAASTNARTIQVTGIVADPAKSHFFNTDCVSCHTETRLLHSIPGTTVPGVDVSVLPVNRWNVRNFGWGAEGSNFKATITRRTALETDEVVKATNELLGK